MQMREKRISVSEILAGTKNESIQYESSYSSEKWFDEQKSLLIHSILAGYLVPPIVGYSLKLADGEGFRVKDGRQRLKAVFGFVEGEFRLSENLPEISQRRRIYSVNEENGESQWRYEDEEFDISGLSFSEMAEWMTRKILDFKFSVVLIDDCPPLEVSQMICRLNNRKFWVSDSVTYMPLPPELEIFVEEQEEKRFFVNKVEIDHWGREAARSCILNAAMLVLDFKFINLNKTSRSRFSNNFDKIYQDVDLEYCAEVIDRFDEAFQKVDVSSELLNEENVPIFVYMVQIAEKNEMSMEEYGQFIKSCIGSYTEDSEFGKLCSGKTEQHENIAARMNIVETEMNNWRKAA